MVRTSASRRVPRLTARSDATLHSSTQAVRANVRISVNQLRHGSQVLEELVDKDGLLIVGAEYALETGAVDFFDGVPPSR